jgi:hypothetical protein
MIPKSFRLIAAVVFCVTSALAQEIKVDINANNRPLSETPNQSVTHSAG